MVCPLGLVVVLRRQFAIAIAGTRRACIARMRYRSLTIVDAGICS